MAQSLALLSPAGERAEGLRSPVQAAGLAELQPGGRGTHCPVPSPCPPPPPRTWGAALGSPEPCGAALTQYSQCWGGNPGLSWEAHRVVQSPLRQRCKVKCLLTAFWGRLVAFPSALTSDPQTNVRFASSCPTVPERELG